MRKCAAVDEVENKWVDSLDIVGEVMTFIMLSSSAQLRLIWDLSSLKSFIGQSAPTNFLLCNMLFLFEYIAQFQITVLVRYGSGWSQFYQLSSLLLRPFRKKLRI